jgi:hypothetical protein
MTYNVGTFLQECQMELSAEQLRTGIEVPKSVRESLRGMRLDHWREYLRSRQCESLYRSAGQRDKANWFRSRATVHMLAVQTLNEFFPIGDYAEQDHVAAGPVVSHETLPLECCDEIQL